MNIMSLLERFRRYVPLVVWILVCITLLCIPLKIIGYGFLPLDDSNRHAAKVVSGKDWDEVMVMKEGVIHDHNPGWHAVLGLVHRTFDTDTDGLISFSVVVLLMLVFLCVLPWFRRPEAYVATLLLAYVTGGGLVRYALGRPFILSISVLLILLAMWAPERPRKSPWLFYALTTGLLTLAVWIHGSWYLFTLPIAAFVLARRFEDAARLTGCFLVAVFCGALLTGHPVDFVVGQIEVLLGCFEGGTLQKFLVSEFQPTTGAGTFILVVIGFLLWKMQRGHRLQDTLRDPIFLMGVIGWILGLRVMRFWADWGMPALILWMALEVERAFEENKVDLEAPGRVVFAALACFAFWSAMTADLLGRWTSSLHVEYLEESNPELNGWLPDDGGILYSDDMKVFYRTFGKNPHANWRYILGFEASFMPDEDLQVFRNIQWNRSDPRAFEPWVKKMKPEDRLVYMGPSGTPPGVKGLEWHYAATDTWIGRLPRP